MSADARLARTVAPCGAATRTRYSPPLMPKSPPRPRPASIANLVAVAAGAHRDLGIALELLGIAAVRLELDGGLAGVVGLDLDVPGGNPDVQRDRARGREGFVPHGRRFPRRRGGRGSVFTSACPNGSWKNVMQIPS